MDLVQLLRDADHILVFTGAGVSTGSGIRDFRGPKGVWRERQPVGLEFVIRPPLEAGPCPGSGRSNAHG